MIIGYGRVSTIKQQQKGSSLDYQEQKINDYCRLNDMELKCHNCGSKKLVEEEVYNHEGCHVNPRLEVLSHHLEL